MQLTTSKGKTFSVDWMWGPTIVGQNVMLQLEDSRSISAIAKDFEGVETFKTFNEETGLEAVYENYTSVESISRSTRNNDGAEVIQIALRKPKE